MDKIKVLVVVHNSFDGTTDLYLASLAKSHISRLRNQDDEISPAMSWALCPTDQNPPTECVDENCGDVFGLLSPYKLEEGFTGPMETIEEVIKVGLY